MLYSARHLRSMSILSRLALLAALHISLGSAATQAQESDRWLTVEPKDDPCITLDALKQRTESYLQTDSPRHAVAIDVIVAHGKVSFSVKRKATQLAHRQFTELPTECAARIDAVALAIALALEAAGEGRVVFETSSTPGGSENLSDDATAKSDTGFDSDPGEVPKVSQGGGASGSANGTSTTRTADSQPKRAALDPRQHEETEMDDDGAPVVAESASSTPWSLRLAAGAGVVLGVKPDASWVLKARAALQFDHLSIEVGGLWSPHSQNTVADVRTGKAKTALYAGHLGACWSDQLSVFSTDACLSVLAGALTGQGVGFDSNQHVSLPWLATALSVGARLPLAGPFGCELRVDALQNVVQPVVVVEGPSGGRQSKSLLGLITIFGLYWAPP